MCGANYQVWGHHKPFSKYIIGEYFYWFSWIVHFIARIRIFDSFFIFKKLFQFVSNFYFGLKHKLFTTESVEHQGFQEFKRKKNLFYLDKFTRAWYCFFQYVNWYVYFIICLSAKQSKEIKGKLKENYWNYRISAEQEWKYRNYRLLAANVVVLLSWQLHTPDYLWEIVINGYWRDQQRQIRKLIEKF